MIYNKLRVKRTQIKRIIFLRLLLLHIKVGRSEDRKVAGVIIFSDPADHTNPGEEYPNGWMLNRYGVQRGTINRLPGDALSIGYPSKGL